MESNQRVAVVTGGAMGIGAEVCRQLAASGLKIIVADLDLQAATGMVDKLVGDGHAAQALQMDVGRPESIAEGFARISQEHGRCDVLVNCAGIAKVMPFLDFPLDNFVATMNVNVTGTLLCSQHAARLIVKHR